MEIMRPDHKAHWLYST